MERRVLLIADGRARAYVNRYRKYLEPSSNPPVVVPQSPDQYKCFALPANDKNSSFQLSEHSSVFFWPLFDEIVLQDLYSGQGADDVGRSPLAVASHLFFARGQFSLFRRTKISPLMLNPGALLAACHRLGRDTETAALSEMRARLMSELDRGWLWRAIPEERERGASTERALTPSLPVSVSKELRDEFIEQVMKGRIALWMVDDERKWLADAYEQIEGTPPPPPPDASANARFWVLKKSSAQATLEYREDFNELRDTLLTDFKSPADGLRVLVSDILFARVPNRNGLDLIREMRTADARQVPRTVVLAFTGYGNPIMTTACYHEEADFVVQKVGSYSHGQAAESGDGVSSPFDEMYWNLLWLNAVAGFTVQRLSEVHETIKRSGHPASHETMDKLVQTAHRDIEAVFPVDSWFFALRRWRQTVTEILDDLTLYCAAVGNADADQAELNRWRGALNERLQQFLNIAPGPAWLK